MTQQAESLNSRSSGTANRVADRSTRREYAKVAFASAIGTMVEYYDFTLYATATAIVFNRIFFPSDNALISTIAAFATFFIGYCARPLGGILFGHFGDRVGRRNMLLLTVLIMGIGTFLIGLMPTYAQIGVWAPVLLLVLRLLQGIGIGGEYGGGMVMAIEHAPPRMRAFCSSVVHIGLPAGFLLPIALMGGLSAALTDEQFLSWGWRLPFIGSIVLVGLGLFIRFRIDESPDFEAAAREKAPPKLPLAEALREHWLRILLGIGAKIAESGLFNIYAVFAITYAVTVHHLPKSLVLNGILVGCLVECVTLPIFGWCADKFGRKPVYVGGALLQAVFAAPFFWMMDAATAPSIWIAVSIGLGLGHGAMFGAQGAFFSELFPARVRYTSLSLVQQIGPILGGGLSPLVATALLMQFNSYWPIAAYMAAIAVLSALCALALPETKPAAECR
ncbi:MFS transporter [Paraburkholderia susongensis]|uniref:Metabolite-proton symporter n=1 Tax=Paraburkholderia susongensis TaxID=1515439 RepID=A0A1X7LKL8_9BURK|nr:MFS transporter [Paraburkholderia susongensis]SMG54087.1 metabolite-proton symporter [Paraburkholderia susongensis]